jgi:3-oxoacyl-[acyl-carrier protein] reductase
MKGMMKKRWGRIINMTSVIGFLGNAGQVNYASAKAGLVGLTKSMARELASRTITVNCVAPGYIVTDMTSDLSAEVQEAIKKQIPLGTLGQAQDVAAAVAFLASPESGYITGQTLHVNGGMYMGN